VGRYLRERGVKEAFGAVAPDPVKHVQRVYVEKFGGRPLYRLTLVIDLNVALTEVDVRFVLVPSNHEVAVSLDPLNRVTIVRMSPGKIERDL